MTSHYLKTIWIFVIFVYQSADANFVKKNVCSITINSNNEINSFRKSLPADKFNFYELTSSDSQNWFQNACASNVQCDVLLLSGHFASQFFGDRGLHLTTQQLEEKSCLKTCAGVTQAPKEIFLFGCNTLADKKPDQRTPQQYMQILINDGFRESTARTIAMARYSPVDHSFRQRMNHVFQSAPIIYGFSAAAPKGVYAETPVTQFVQDMGDYSKHLDLLADANVKFKTQELSKSQKIWKKHFAVYNGASEIKTEDISEETQLVCQANNFVKSKNNALVSLEILLQKENRLAYLLLAEKLLRNLTYSMLNTDEKIALEKIKTNLEFKNEVLSGFQYLSYNIDLSLKVIRMMNFLGWLSIDQNNEFTSETLGKFLTQQNLKNSDYESICDSGFWHRDFSYQFTNLQLANPKLIRVLSCLRVKNKQIIEQLQQLYNDPSVSRSVKSEIYIFLYRLGI